MILTDSQYDKHNDRDVSHMIRFRSDDSLRLKRHLPVANPDQIQRSSMMVKVTCDIFERHASHLIQDFGQSDPSKERRCLLWHGESQFELRSCSPGVALKDQHQTSISVGARKSKVIAHLRLVRCRCLDSGTGYSAQLQLHATNQNFLRLFAGSTLWLVRSHANSVLLSRHWLSSL